MTDDKSKTVNDRIQAITCFPSPLLKSQRNGREHKFVCKAHESSIHAKAMWSFVCLNEKYQFKSITNKCLLLSLRRTSVLSLYICRSFSALVRSSSTVNGGSQTRRTFNWYNCEHEIIVHRSSCVCITCPTVWMPIWMKCIYLRLPVAQVQGTQIDQRTSSTIEMLCTIAICT